MSMILGNNIFELNTQTRDTAFFLHKDDGFLEYSIDCSFNTKEFDGENISPYLCINPIITNVLKKEELIGKNFTIDNIEQSDEREDIFYVFEHEPIENYRLTILNIKNSKAHIECSGTAIIDGYASPYITEKFKINCWLPIITNVSDWIKFDL